MREIDIRNRDIRGQVDGCDGLDTLTSHGVGSNSVRGEVHVGALVPHMVHGSRLVGLHVQGDEEGDGARACSDLGGGFREVESEVPGNHGRVAALHGAGDGVGVHHGYACVWKRDQGLGSHHGLGGGVDAPAHPTAA